MSVGSAHAQEIFESCAQALGSLEPQADKPEETLAATIRALWHTAAGTPVSARAAIDLPLPELDRTTTARLRELVAARASGTPLAHLVRRQHFMDLELLASPDALIPRVETEILGRAALEKVREVANERGIVIVVDLCTGSGNLALALACHEPRAQVWASDLSREAIALAEKNRAHLAQTHPDVTARTHFLVGDLLEALRNHELEGEVDVLVCNPPYISSGRVDVLPREIADFEPRLAFDGGPLGIRILQRVIHDAPEFLRPGGWLAFEVGAGQGSGVRKRLEGRGTFSNIQEMSDDAGETRALVAQSNGQSQNR